MPLDPQQLEFYLERINDADMNTLHSSANHLFDYLKQEANDNPKFLYYEKESKKWGNWPEGQGGVTGTNWTMPNDIKDTKSLSYYVYKSIANNSKQANQYVISLFYKRNLNDNIYELNKVFFPYLTEAITDILLEEIPINNKINKQPLGNKIFIIHGHDNHLKKEVQLLLERADLDDVVLHEKLDKGRTLIEKLIEEGIDAGYVIALLSPDDLQHDGSYRARQNVILEIGYFIGLLGRDRVRILKKEGVDIPSDLQGILYEPYDDAGNWRMKILKEIEAVGIEVNFKKVLEKY